MHLRLIPAVLLLFAAMVARADGLPAYPFVTSSGKAETWLAPQLGEIKFEINGIDRDAGHARDYLLGFSSEVLDHLKAMGVADADIEAWDITRKTMPVTQADKNAPPAFVYVIGRVFHVYVRDLAKWNETLAPLLGRNNFEGLSVEFSRTDADEVRKKLLQEAAQNARTEASGLAASFSRKLGDVVAISQSAVTRLGSPFGLAAADPAAAAKPPARPARELGNAVPAAIPYSVAVNAIFKLK